LNLSKTLRKEYRYIAKLIFIHPDKHATALGKEKKEMEEKMKELSKAYFNVRGGGGGGGGV
jgi:preprotein translocase subunit Sec63